jgi:predicted RNase H-like HicB family nuclease
LHSYRGYSFTIGYAPKPPAAFLVDFPDIPEIITSGSTLTEAFDHACEALDLYIETMDKLERPLPIPRHRLVVQEHSRRKARVAVK